MGARFLYFSTDYVFDGQDGAYSEESATHPLSVYGQAKREAEVELARLMGDRQLTMRTSWVFGPERQGKNFAYQLLKSLAGKKPMVCPEDQVSSPSYGPDVAGAAVWLAEQQTGGLIHLAGPEVMDRVQFARAIARAFGHDPGLIVGKPTSELGQEAPRPLQGGLLTGRLEALHSGHDAAAGGRAGRFPRQAHRTRSSASGFIPWPGSRRPDRNSRLDTRPPPEATLPLDAIDPGLPADGVTPPPPSAMDADLVAGSARPLLNRAQSLVGLRTLAFVLVIVATSLYLLERLEPVLRPLLIAVLLSYLFLPVYKRLRRHMRPVFSFLIIAVGNHAGAPAPGPDGLP